MIEPAQINPPGIEPAAEYGRPRTLMIFALVLLGFVAVGRLAMEAWMNRPAPSELPEIGARTDEARPFCLIIIDGLREASAWTDDDPPMPWLQSFGKRGAWGTAIAGEPTLTAPCVRTLLTGRRPDLLTGFRNFNARPVRGSVIGYLHDRGARTAHGGDAAAFQFCRNHYRDEDVLQFPDKGPTDQGGSDKLATPFVIGKIEEGCSCVTLHVTGPDHAGHKYGALGREYWQACRVVDGQIQRTVEVFLARYPQGTVLIAADHGVSAMGTHGGGEDSAKRAPFVLVGPGVVPVHVPAVDQSALAPTLCALLGLPQPPLADAPPAPQLMHLPEAVEQAALKSYVEARLIVARDLHGDAVDIIERRRAELSVESLTSQVNALLLPNSVGHASAALLLSAFWLAVLVSLISVRGRFPKGRTLLALFVSATGFLLVFDPVPMIVSVTPFVAGAMAVLGCVLAWWASNSRVLLGAAVTLGCLATMPVFTGGGLTLQETFTRATDPSVPAARFSLVLAFTAGLLLIFLRPRALLARLLSQARAAPGLVVTFGGVLLGFTLTLRPFIDPYIHVMILYAAVGCLVVGLMLLSRGARERPVWERIALALVGLVLFVATRVAEGMAGQVWVNATPMRDALWLALGTLLLVPLLALVPWRTLRKPDTAGLILAAGALVLAYGLRANRDASLWVTLGANVLALAALLVSVRRGTPDGRLIIRLLATVALARRLSTMDAEFAVFALAAVGAALAARMRVPRTRLALAWLAVGLLAIRTAIFHAMGFEESFSTLDVGQAFAGLGGGEVKGLDAAGGAVVTWQIVVATAQMGLRMALPWMLIVAALMRSVERTPGLAYGSMRCVMADLTVSLAARGAAISTALWAWWRNSWWMTHAYTVYAYAAGDVILLLLCATLCGVWRQGGALEEREVPSAIPGEEGLSEPLSA